MAAFHGAVSVYHVLAEVRFREPPDIAFAELLIRSPAVCFCQFTCLAIRVALDAPAGDELSHCVRNL